MKLTAFDEFPFHQHPTPFHIPYTSDVHFNDGYFCATFSEDWYVVCGIRLHPNMNVMDGFVGIARNGEQRVLRVSRALRPNAGELSVGPLRIDVRRPMQEVRITLEDHDGGFGFDLTYHARSEPFVEAPYRLRKYGHLTYDMLRYTQVCRTTGSVRLDGATTQVEDWDAIRDHSWGVRDGMGPATKHGGTQREPEEVDARRFRIWVPMATDQYVGFINTHEDEEGNTLDFEGRLDYPDGKVVHLTAVKHQLVYAPGTKNVVAGKLQFREEGGRWREYMIRAAGTPADVQGLGYYGGWKDGGSAGVYRGAGPVIENDRYPSAAHLGKTGLTRLPHEKRLGPTEFPCYISGPDGEKGMAHFEHHVFGPYAPYKFG